MIPNQTDHLQSATQPLQVRFNSRLVEIYDWIDNVDEDIAVDLPYSNREALPPSIYLSSPPDLSTKEDYAHELNYFLNIISLLEESKTGWMHIGNVEEELALAASQLFYLFGEARSHFDAAGTRDAQKAEAGQKQKTVRCKELAQAKHKRAVSRNAKLQTYANEKWACDPSLSKAEVARQLIDEHNLPMTVKHLVSILKNPAENESCLPFPANGNTT